jgi:hypothetical protein
MRTCVPKDDCVTRHQIAAETRVHSVFRRRQLIYDDLHETKRQALGNANLGLAIKVIRRL